MILVLFSSSGFVTGKMEKLESTDTFSSLNFLIKLVNNYVVELLSFCVNNCIRECVFPSILKI